MSHTTPQIPTFGTRLVGYERQLTEWNVSFLASISRILLRLESADELMGIVAAKIGAYLNLSRCDLIEIDEGADEAVVTHDWQREPGGGIRGVYRISDFVTEQFLQAAHAGEALVVRDLATATDPRAEPEKLAALGIASFVCVPILPDGQLRFTLFVCHSVPYDWRDDEVALVRELAARIWIRLERARAEEALRDSEARYRGLFNSIDEGFCVIEMIFDEGGKPVDYRFLELNPSFEKQSGLHDALGKRMRELAPDHETHWFETLGKVALTGEPIRFCNEARALNSRWFDVYAFRLLGPESRKVAVLFTDITERRRLEASLIARAEELARADRSKDEFLAMLAHELRNPLAPLRNASEILKAPNAGPAERKRAQLILERQIENMSRMIDDLLDVSRITQRKIKLRRKAVDLNALLTAVAALARADCAAHGQHLAVSMPSEPVYVDADETRLEQVFNNLLANACKYAGDGCHVWLSVEVVPPSGSWSCSDPVKAASKADEGESNIKSREVIIRVRDDGAGVDPELLPRVFDLFVQSSRTLDRAHSGLGIGLTLVQRLVQLHGGSVEARSEGLGRGAEFIVRLPILRETPLRPARTSAPVRETPRRILIVDDNTDSARSLAMLQTLRGHATRTAFTGPDAIVVAADFLPDVVVLDIGLPGMDGFEVARQMRAMPALSKTFLVAMTGYESDEYRKRARDAGFDKYIVKPVDVDLLRGIEDLEKNQPVVRAKHRGKVTRLSPRLTKKRS